MRRISPDFIEQIRLANDIVDIISEDTFLKRVGSRYMGLCPFPGHNEKTPSFSVSQDKQLYHCFGCGESGNIFTYLQVKKGFHFMEAVKILAMRAGLSLPEIEEGDNTQYQEQKKLLEINKMVCDFYEENLQNLPTSHPVKKYLKERDLSEEMVKIFRLGYASDDWDRLLLFLKQKGGDLHLAQKLGLIKKKTHYYDFFRNRLMFPVFAKNGRDILAFGGRTLEEDQAKYINSTDSLLFHKGKTFYGWQHAISFIRDSGKVVVVEGYTDYLSLYQRGIKNVVATLGTALTEEHAFFLSHYTEQVILSFDGDEAGQKAAQRSLKVLLSAGLTPKLLKLEQSMDPDSVIRKKGKEYFWKKVQEAPDLFLYLFSEELKKYPIGVDRLSLVHKIAHLLAHTKKEVLRQYYTNRFLDSFGFDEKVARQALGKALNKQQQELRNKNSGSNSVNVSFRDTKEKKTVMERDKKKGEMGPIEQNYEKFSLKSALKAELYLLILALQSPSYYKEIKNSGVIEKFNHSGIIKMFGVISEYSKQELKCFEALTQILSRYLLDPRELQKDNYPSLAYLSQEKVKYFIKDCINKVEEEKQHAQLKSITASMRLDKENSEKYLMKIAQWTKKSKSTENKI